MSRASAKIVFEDGYELFTLYDGSVDILWTKLTDDLSVAWGEMRDESFKNHGAHPKGVCTCGKDEPVVIVAEYGCGMVWESRACRYCKAVTGYLNELEHFDHTQGSTYGQ